ncbi:hypothetical protein PhaeoP97_03696 (plasmid) [Phaeobacter porticola]|uniref:Uncharacterized protein n=1 Tax=Phaeobacter porticola TaxID=1844006 RepID=A0A1L3IAC7_9RHOB|nr:hypothetical protein PhaeoP97_03696 [Phaeobacter porticola]
MKSWKPAVAFSDNIRVRIDSLKSCRSQSKTVILIKDTLSKCKQANFVVSFGGGVPQTLRKVRAAYLRTPIPCEN